MCITRCKSCTIYTLYMLYMCQFARVKDYFRHPLVAAAAAAVVAAAVSCKNISWKIFPLCIFASFCCSF